jgi:hypothetical protein
VGNQFTCLWQDRDVTRQFNTAVSLHGHTNLSKESLYFMGEYMTKHPLIRHTVPYFHWRASRVSDIKPDLWKAYWTPPLPPLQAFTVERKQIEEDLGLQSQISLTDHDTIQAPLLLRVVPEARRIPVSLEWSIPFAGTIFHLGVHNLPTSEAEVWMQRMAAFTAQPQPQELRDLLAALARIPQTLIVFNHPLWDLPSVGRLKHTQAMKELLAAANEFFHAFELGGLRGWKENHDVIELARAYRRPFIAGGDRHGCEPSALLNLTNAGSFSEFVAEVREGHSEVLAMPQYADCKFLRVYRTVLDVIREYPDHPTGARHWDERIYHPDLQGVHRPLSMLWDFPSIYIERMLDVVRLGDTEPVRRALEFALKRNLRVPKIELEAGQEMSL